MRSGGSIHLVGIGPADKEGISVGALTAIREADEIWMGDLGPVNHERSSIRDELVGKRVVNLYGFYLLPGCSRVRFYRLMAHRMVHLARRGHQITFLLSGNPEYWVHMTELLKHHAQSRRVVLRTTHSMSFLDTVYGPTPFACMGALQVRLATIRDPDISPEIDCIVGQLADSSTTEMRSADALRDFCRDLSSIYPEDHPIFVVGHHSVDGAPLYRVASVGTLRASVGGIDAYHYSLLIPSTAHVRQVERHRDTDGSSGVGYLLTRD